MNKYIKFVVDNNFRFDVLAARGFYNHVSDEDYLKRKFLDRVGYNLNMDNPTTFNEKLQYLKIHNRRSEYTVMVDKYRVKQYVANRIGEQYVIPLIMVWNSPDNIDISVLPNQFVLKCNHAGGVIVCKDKATFNFAKAKKELVKNYRRDYFYSSREWPYKDVPKKIIAEKYMEDTGHDVLPVYKFMCFNGEPKIIQVIQNDKQPSESIDYFDVDWTLYNLKQNFPNSKVHLLRPRRLKEMIEIAGILSEGIPFVRVDLYEINGEVYFSEFTFFSDGGFAKFEPEVWDKRLGNWICLN